MKYHEKNMSSHHQKKHISLRKNTHLNEGEEWGYGGKHGTPLRACFMFVTKREKKKTLLVTQNMS